MQVSSRSYLFFVEWVAKYIRFRNEPAHSHQACGLNRIYLATAKVGGILFEITPFGSPHRLLEDEKINIYANTFERYQFVTIVDHKKGRSCMLDQQICRNWGMFGQSSAGIRTIHHPIPGIKSRNGYTPEKGFLF